MFSQIDDKKAPANYIAGLGRGAVGFITRSDIGPSRMMDQAPIFPSVNPSQAKPDTEREEMKDYSDSKYDEWAGFNEQLFSGGDYDEEDREADHIYGIVDKHMDQRRKARREQKMQEQIKKLTQERPSIKDQFKDLKRGLATMTKKDWESIPEMQDYTIKKQKRDKYVPMSDNILNRALNENSYASSINITTQDGVQSSILNINEIGNARQTMFNVKMNKEEDSVKGKSKIDTDGYLTDLNSVVVNSKEEIGDLKKARLIMKSAVNSNPKSAPGWIAAARIEEHDGKLDTARNILAQGIEYCPENEDIWLEAVRIERPEKQKAVMARAISSLPNSVKLWQAACSQEKDKDQKSKVLKRALEMLPGSVTLWKQLIQLEGEQEAKKLLYHAVECVPQCLDMWIELAKLESYENAKLILNRARQNLPLEHSIWIHAAMLEESEQKGMQNVEMVLKRAVKVLQKNGQVIKRDVWLDAAMDCEMNGNIMTGQAIVRITLEIGVELEDQIRTFLDDAENCENKNRYETARAILALLVENFKNDENAWLKKINFEMRMLKIYPNYQHLDADLQQAVQFCPKYEDFWLMLAKHKWINLNDIEGARGILEKSIQINPLSEKIILAFTKFEKTIGNISNARKILEQARVTCKDSWRVRTRSVKLEIQENNIEYAVVLCDEAFKIFQKIDKIWIMYAQLLIIKNNIHKARQIFDQALQINKTSQKLWVQYANLEIEQNNISRARTLLEKARMNIPNNEELWYHSFILEKRTHNQEAIYYMIAKALQNMPNSGELWSLAVENEPKRTRKAKIVDAMKKGENNPYVVLSIAKIFWKEKKYEKARKWMERSLALDANIGDTWAYYWKFILTQEGQTQADIVKQKCIQQDPTKGRMWREIKKNKQKIRYNNEQILEMLGGLIEDQMNQIE